MFSSLLSYQSVLSLDGIDMSVETIATDSRPSTLQLHSPEQQASTKKRLAAFFARLTEPVAANPVHVSARAPVGRDGDPARGRRFVSAL